MCGIVGIINRKQYYLSNKLENLFSQLLYDQISRLDLLEIVQGLLFSDFFL